MTRPLRGYRTYPRAVLGAIVASLLVGLLFGTLAYLGVGWLLTHQLPPPAHDGHYLIVRRPWWTVCAGTAFVGMVTALPRCLWRTHRRRVDAEVSGRA